MDIQIMNDFVSSEIHANLWDACMSKNWYFGHSSVDGGAGFWKMDLSENAATNALWDCGKEKCEILAGSPLKVLRQYANGHTYGLGGKAHVDDTEAGTYTLLYYPMLEWDRDWGGETVYYTKGYGEISGAVRPLPNRAVFFESTIPHLGRAPERSFLGLRVTVAFKLRAITS